MTDPHDYELTDEEHDALVAISEHAVAPPLSPAASAVLNAANKYATKAWSGATHERHIQGVVAALRAASSQLTSAKAIDKLRAIADELEALRDV